MGELYERLLDQHPLASPNPAKKDKLYTDGLQACMRLFRAGLITIDQIDAYFADQCGAPLGTDATGDNAGRQEAQDLLATIPTGSTTANQLARLTQVLLIEAVLVIADTKTAPFNTPAALRTVFGVPDRS